MRPIAAMFIAGMAVLVWAPAGSAAATRAGNATVVAPYDNQSAPTPIAGGTSATSFSLKLPASASCPGDSANAGYRVQSYMVPASIDPATLQFGSVGPVPVGTGVHFRQPLFDSHTNPYANAQTAAAVHAGDPGPIINIPAFTFSVFKTGDVPAGTYNIGIACTKGQASATQLDTFWGARMTLAPAGGGGGSLTWSVPGARSPAGASSLAASTGNGNGTTAAQPDAAGGDIRTVDLRVSGPGVRSHRSAQGSKKRTSSGAPPSLGDPLGELRSLIPLPGRSPGGLVEWAVGALVVVRVAMLVLRRPSRISLGAR